MTHKRAFGYISSTPFWRGQYIPQKIQNLIVRDYCIQKDINFVWSLPEISLIDSSLSFNELLRLRNEKDVTDIVFISSQMHKPNLLRPIINTCFAENVNIHFAIENEEYNLCSTVYPEVAINKLIYESMMASHRREVPASLLAQYAKIK